MRIKFINFLKGNPFILNTCWFIARKMLEIASLFIKTDDKLIVFSSFGGRKFDDSPKAIYDEICLRKEFNDYKLVWFFVNPDIYDIPRGEKIKIDTFSFFYNLLKAKVWVSNTGMDRGINIKKKNLIKVETWHGTPLKKICGDENLNTIGGKKKHSKKVDNNTIRCSQSEYDRKLFSRLFDSSEDSILLSDLPRNDKLFHYSKKEIECIKEKLNIENNKKIILYTPTYREYLVNENRENYIAPPIDLEKWKNKLGNKYVLLIRAHYAVDKSLNIKENDFVKNVSNYPCLNDLFIISDMMISDYSSTYFDYSILGRPMFCFAYDLEEYEEKRGLYLNLKDTLPCPINSNEDKLIDNILNFDEKLYKKNVYKFHKKFTPNAGNASKMVVDKIYSNLKKEDFNHEKSNYIRNI